jgi:hypothetical protein
MQSHWQTYQRLYLAAIIFVSVNAGAAVVVFGSLSDAQLAGLTHRQFALDVVKCLALASANLLTYITASAKPTPTPAAPTTVP